MSLRALRQQPSIDGADWITVEEAASLTGQTVRHWQRLASHAWNRSLARKAPPPNGRGKPVWWVHRSLDQRLTRYPAKLTREDRARDSLLSKYPAHAVNLAYLKAVYLRKWREACERSRRLTNLQVAEQIVAEARRVGDVSITARTLQMWHRAYNEIGSDGQIRGVAALIDGRAMPTRSADRQPRSPDAEQYFYDLFHAPSRLSRRMCHEATLREAGKNGWRWPKAYTSTTRWLRDNDRLDITCLMRDGAGAYSHRYMTHLQTDFDIIVPGELFVADHSQCDLWISYRDRQIRPWLTAVQDVRSRVIVGWHLGPAPHSDAIALAFRSAFCDWAIPLKMRIDNGKDFCSKFLTGLTKADVRRLRREFGGEWKEILRRKREAGVEDVRWLGLTPELGIELIYAIPYAAWSKGTVERFFGTFEEQCGKTFATYCSNRPGTKPECLEQIRKGKGHVDPRSRRALRGLELVDGSDVPTLEEARTRVGEYIELYHRREHQGDGMNGRTPLAVWATATQVQKAEPESLAFLMNIRGLYKVTGNGVTVTVGGTKLSYGARSPVLRRLAGRQVLVGVDLEHPTECFAFDAKSRRLLGRLEPNKRIHPCASTDDVREAIAEQQRDRKVMRSAMRTGARRMRTATQRINAHTREKLAELRATGTDDTAASPNITPVRTGFEGASDRVRKPVDKAVTDRKARDLAAARTALELGVGLSEPRPKRRRVSDDLLRGDWGNTTDAVVDDGSDDTDGKDAGAERQDVFALLARSDRHEQRTDTER